MHTAQGEALGNGPRSEPKPHRGFARIGAGGQRACLACLACLLLAAAPAAGEESEEADLDQLSEEERRGLEDLDLETVLVKARRLDAGGQTTAFGECLEVKEASMRVETVSEVLSDAVGVQVRRLGGLGSYGAASIRGSTPSQVPVYLDGVLLNGGGFAVVDLGTLALDTLSRIEVYRGFAPIELSTAGIGGALHLRTRDFEHGRTELALSAGSFDSLRLHAFSGHRLPWAEAELLGAVSLERSAGDFDYLNRNGTLFNPDDDRIQPRSNNDHRALNALAKLECSLADWRLTLAESFQLKDQGIAGIDSVPTEHARLGTARSALSLRALRPLGESAKLGLDASWLYLHDDFDDSFGAHGELGLGRQHALASTHALALGGLFQALLAPEHLSAARLEGRWERFGHQELVLDQRGQPADRLRMALAAQHEWTIWQRLSALPSVRLEYLHSAFGGGILPGGLGQMEPVNKDDFLWQAALGLRWEAVAGLTFQANGGRSVRTPDIAELFGDRGSVIGNAELRPETGFNADAGLIWILAGRGPLDLLRVELIGFGSWTDDLIVLVQNSQSTVRSENVDAAEILGLETSLRLELWERLSLSANYTYLHAINRSETPYYEGKRLPGRPVHEVFSRIAFEQAFPRWGIKLWFDVDYAGQNDLTPANLEEDALARLLFGAGFRMSHAATGLSMSVEVKNLCDSFVLHDAQGRQRPLRDFASFPLPGRTIMATLHWRC
ncbi:MAG: TonB-dependent receptor [Deltaproteobacteria bacterium]|nr:TonB-dependent receptor [Deltaproteobacteria bacterium]